MRLARLAALARDEHRQHLPDLRIIEGALLREDLEVHSVFKTYWPAASADSFSPNLRRTTTP